MFELGLDQAHGLRQLFVPLSDGKVNVIGISPDNAYATAVLSIGKALIDRGFDVQWEDPDELLPANLPSSTDINDTQITIAASRKTPEKTEDTTSSVHCVFVAQPHPDQLTKLYSAMKSIAQNNEPDLEPKPFTVLWCGIDSADIARRTVCETNLSEAITRFLFRSVEFVDSNQFSPGTIQSGRGSTDVARHPFIERLSTVLLKRVGQSSQFASSLAN